MKINFHETNLIKFVNTLPILLNNNHSDNLFVIYSVIKTDKGRLKICLYLKRFNQNKVIVLQHLNFS